jgi:hypothetical protein
VHRTLGRSRYVLSSSQYLHTEEVILPFQLFVDLLHLAKSEG